MSSPLYYNRDGTPFLGGDLEFWQSYGIENRRVARTKVTDAADPAKSFDVSTVFLGIDHNWLPGGLPLIFETMVFAEDSSRDQDCWRYPTEATAREGHVAMVILIAATLTDPIVMDTE